VQYHEILDTVHATVSPPVGCGRVADYIPGLADVDPRRFGLALATTDSTVYGVGDWQTPLSIQSISKVFSLAVALSRHDEAIWRRVGTGPVGSSACPQNSQRIRARQPPCRCWIMDPEGRSGAHAG
jgi:glutaminase